ncbi:MAG: EFR1 family ferrodoxin [Bacteroidota bacterium]
MNAPENISLYCFSGTGNALIAAQWMQELAISKDVSTELICIDRFNEITLPKAQSNSTIGFFYPTHGFCMPWIMLRYMMKFPALKNTQVFFVNTRGGVRIWKLHLPGVSGMAHILAALIFLFKGMKIIGAHPIDSPHNFISIAPPQNKRGQEAMIKRNKRSLIRFGERILNNKFSYSIKAWISLPLDILLIPITFAYLVMARFIIGKLLYATSNCNNCDICINSCPCNAIEKVFNRPYWTVHCESCMRCMNICPQKSIQSWGTRFILTYILVFPLYLIGIKYIHAFLIQAPLLSFISENTFGILFNFILIPIYFVFSWLISFTFINKLITYTSLSYIWGRFINPLIKIKDLIRKR